VVFGTGSNLKALDAKVHGIDSDFKIYTRLPLFGLCNSKSVNHLVESRHLKWKRMFPGYIF